MKHHRSKVFCLSFRIDCFFRSRDAFGKCRPLLIAPLRSRFRHAATHPHKGARPVLFPLIMAFLTHLFKSPPSTFPYHPSITVTGCTSLAPPPDDNPGNGLLRLIGRNGSIIFEIGTTRRLETRSLEIPPQLPIPIYDFINEWMGIWQCSEATKYLVFIRSFDPPGDFCIERMVPDGRHAPVSQVCYLIRSRSWSNSPITC